MTAAVVLAAGGSARLGRPKQLVRVDGLPLVRRAARAAVDAGCDPVIVVVGAHARDVRQALEGLPVETVSNRHWRRGVAGSIRAGVLAATARRADGVALLACDQVHLDAAVVRRLLEASRREPGRPVGCAYAGIVGVPAWFPESCFSALLGLRGDRGARDLLRDGPAGAVAWPAGSEDLDRPGHEAGA